MKQVLIDKPGIARFLQIWQILELIGLLFAIPTVLLFGVMLLGDSNSSSNDIISIITPLMIVFLLIKIIVTIFFFKAKRWAVYFNFFQNLIFLVLILIGIIAIIYSSLANPVDLGSFLILLLPLIPGVALYIFLSNGYHRCLKHPYYGKSPY